MYVHMYIHAFVCMRIMKILSRMFSMIIITCNSRIIADGCHQKFSHFVTFWLWTINYTMRIYQVINGSLIFKLLVIFINVWLIALHVLSQNPHLGHFKLTKAAKLSHPQQQPLSTVLSKQQRKNLHHKSTPATTPWPAIFKKKQL